MTHEDVDGSFESSLSLLRSSGWDDGEDDMEGEARLIRQIHLQKTRYDLKYWMPTLVGAGVCAIGFLALLQIVGSPIVHELPSRSALGPPHSERLPGLSDYKDVSALRR